MYFNLVTINCESKLCMHKKTKNYIKENCVIKLHYSTKTLNRLNAKTHTYIYICDTFIP